MEPRYQSEHGVYMPAVSGHITPWSVRWRLSTGNDLHCSEFPFLLVIICVIPTFGCDSFLSTNFSNVAAGGTMGYIGVSLGKLGVPFVNPYTLYNFRNPALIGGAVYGAMAGAMATLGGKPM